MSWRVRAPPSEQGPTGVADSVGFNPQCEAAITGGGTMKLIGLRTHRGHVSWALVEGSTRSDACLVDSGELVMPTGDRADQLAWMVRETAELLSDHEPDRLVVAPAEGRTANTALLERSQVDGVVLAAATAQGVTAEPRKSATIRASFGARNNQQFASRLDEIALLSSVPASAARRDPMVAALSAMPS